MTEALSNSQAQLLEAFVQANPGITSFRRQDILDFAESNGYKLGTAQGVVMRSPKVSRGVYSVITSSNVVQMPEVSPTTPETDISFDIDIQIPERDPTYVRWGFFNDVKKIIESNLFYPVYIAGLSGNGKTMMVEQACAMTKRKYVRLQITPETDEDDLIGGFRLVNGETVFSKGPVIKAMEAGAILLIDEIDRGSNKLMALQGVLEGKPVLIKKTGELVRPAPGFNVIATANTKGQGDEAGRFIAATIIDEAFLERFTITMEQPYPTLANERKIVLNHMNKFECVDEGFAEKLVQWGQSIRKTFEDGGVEDIVSTRRLCHIVQTFSIFGDQKKSVELCVNRFEVDTRAAFIDLFEKMTTETDSDTHGTYTYENDNPF